ncbi:MAG TPA: PQQ-binding-like beta-propeller repeat protein [Polyangiales bacterium]|nr:PQQ-binding-like beta-propeller repeat protein [Polyangiales bacterium]
MAPGFTPSAPGVATAGAPGPGGVTTTAPGRSNVTGVVQGGVAGGGAATSGTLPAGAMAGTGAVPSTTTAGNPSTVTDPGTPPSARGSWMSFGGNPEHTRAVEGETTISVTNAAMLGTAFDIKAPGVTSTPAVYQGIIYWGDWGGTLHATQIPVGKETPKEVWKLDRSANKGGYSGSPAVTDKVVVAANRNGLVTAVDRMTGTQIWETKLDAGIHTYIWSSTVVAEADGVVVIGIGGAGTRDNGIPLSSSQTGTFHGSVAGLDLATGKMLWQFFPSPDPMGAGCSVWSSGALDLKRKLVFIGVGNNYERPTSDMEDTILALDYMTGTKKWHHQFTSNDAFTAGNITGGVDGDVGATPNLFKIGEKEVVGVGDKPAGYHVLDRDTGTVIWEVKGLTSSSGFQGGVMQPATVADGKVFVVSNNSTISSTLFALNQADGKTLWQASLNAPTFGGSVYGNGVIYTADSDGNIKAFNASDGKSVWMSRAPAGIGGGFSMVDGLLFIGYGYHFSESAKEPLMGGLMGFALGGSAPPPPTTTSDCMMDAVVTADATFTNVYQGVLCRNGCDKVCHTSNTGAAQLGLAGKAMAYTNLVGVGAKDTTACAGKGNRVTAGDPNMSVLYQKLANTQTCGSRMPPGGPVGGDLPAAQLDALKAWIMAGAPNN